MIITSAKTFLLAALLATMSGCGLWSTKGTQYQVPDYYETRVTSAKPVAGKTYYIDDLRCDNSFSGECRESKEEVKHAHRGYKKPYYLSK